MRQQVQDGDRRSARKLLPAPLIESLELVNVAGDRVIQLELAFVSKNQRRDGRKRFGIRGDRVEGVGVGRNLLLDIRKAESTCIDKFLIVNDPDGDPGPVLGLHLEFHPHFERTDRGGNLRMLDDRSCGRGSHSNHG